MVSDPSKKMSQSRVMIACTRRAGAGSTWDPAAFLLPEGSPQASAVDSRRTAKGFGTKNKKDGRVRGRHFLSGKPFSDESYPDFTPCAVHASAKTNAGRQPGRTSWPVKAFCRTISDRESPPSLCLNFTLIYIQNR